MLTCQDVWNQFLEFIQKKISPTEFTNWFSHIKVLQSTENEIVLEVPNIFVQEYILDNYQKDLCAFLPIKENGKVAINFVIKEAKKKKTKSNVQNIISAFSETINLD